jgi:ADP-heptose:LPS heptosyltransferase
MLLAGLRERYPDAAIDRLTPSGGFAPAGLGVDGGEERPGEDGAGRGGIFAASARARRRRYDLAVVNDPSVRGALIPFLAGIPFRIGPGGRAGRLLFSMAIPYGEGEGPRVWAARILATLDPHGTVSPAPAGARDRSPGETGRR